MFENIEIGGKVGVLVLLRTKGCQSGKQEIMLLKASSSLFGKQKIVMKKETDNLWFN